MRFFNTKTRKVEEFIPHNKDEVTMYTCGPTVYHFQHIGNMRTYISEDILEKTLKYIGYNVKRCMNITDVGHLTSDGDTGEDKMYVAAKREQKSVLELAEMYTNIFFDDFGKLNLRKPDFVAKATDNIQEYIKMIEGLLEKGFAYKMGPNIYFDVSKFDDYYALSGKKIDDLQIGARDNVDFDNNKRNQADFVLWFTSSKFENHILQWDSPWGVGYPGWHIECSGISLKYLGEHLDIHCGAVDAIFPHHTNEIAQSECYLGHEWCSYWVHLAFLNDRTGKMSKSKGDFLTIDNLEKKGFKPLSYKFYCLQSNYRNTLSFDFDKLEEAQKTYEKLLNKIGEIKKGEQGVFNQEKFDLYKKKFQEYLENDLNTASAITLIYDIVKDNISNITKIKLFENFDTVLSLDLTKDKEEKSLDANLKNYILEMIEKRKEAKKNKDFALADKIRNELLEKGIVIKDTREGTIYEIKD